MDAGEIHILSNIKHWAETHYVSTTIICHLFKGKANVLIKSWLPHISAFCLWTSMCSVILCCTNVKHSIIKSHANRSNKFRGDCQRSLLYEVFELCAPREDFCTREITWNTGCVKHVLLATICNLLLPALSGCKVEETKPVFGELMYSWPVFPSRATTHPVTWYHNHIQVISRRAFTHARVYCKISV